MSLDFIRKGVNRDKVIQAAEQEEQLTYFTRSKLQESALTQEFITNWASRKYQTDDYFLNYVKSIFKEENFLLFTKYLRFPLPSAKLIKSNVEPQLKRVFYAENQEFTYKVNGKTDDEIKELLNIEQFNEEILEKILYNHNSLIVCDVKDGQAYRYFLPIDRVVSIDVNEDLTINKVAYTACATFEGEEKKGIVYIDEKVYSFYLEGGNEALIEIPHELKRCPVDFISSKKFGDDLIIKESTFTYVREELEEYTFLKTLQKLTEPNGAFPIVSMLEVEEDDDLDVKGSPPFEEAMSSQQAKEYSTNPTKKDGELQAGSVIKVPANLTSDGSVDTQAAQNLLTFHYVPVEVLQNIDNRIKSVKESIITSLVGDVVGGNEEAKNEMQIDKSVSFLENNLLELSSQLNRIRRRTDKNLIDLTYPNRLQSMFIYYGSDFYLDSIYQLMEAFKDAPNPIERKDIIVRMNQNKYKNNTGKQSRQMILYDLLPFVSDKDFELARDVIDGYTLQLQLRFNYWISMFEARYGDITTFYNMLETTDEIRLKTINELMKQIILPNINKQTKK